MGFEASTIDTEIDNLLSGISAIQGHKNEHTTPDGFPYVTYQLNALQRNQMYDTANNLREYQYIIRVWHETQNEGKSEAVRITQDIISDILTKFEESRDLNGAVDFIRPMNVQDRTSTSTHGAMVIYDITLTAVKLVSIR